MGISIGLCSSKGGSAKTTTTAALLVQALREQPRPGRCALIDLDPQKSITEWWRRRGSPDDIRVIGNDDPIPDQLAQLESEGFEWIFLDGPPGALETVKSMVVSCDLIVAPIRASMLDLVASQDAIVLARQAGAPMLCVLSDVGSQEVATVGAAARNMLFTFKLPIADTVMIHRVAHINAMAVGKTAAEIDGERARKAGEDIAALWDEVKVAAIKAAEARRADTSTEELSHAR